MRWVVNQQRPRYLKKAQKVLHFRVWGVENRNGGTKKAVAVRDDGRLGKSKKTWAHGVLGKK